MQVNPHSELVHKLLMALGDRPDLGKFWKQATGAVELPSGAWLHYGLLGSADVSGILGCGCRAELEVKTGSGVQSKEQKNFERMITDYHGLYLIARDTKDTLAAIEAHIKICPKGVLTTLEGVCKK